MCNNSFAELICSENGWRLVFYRSSTKQLKNIIVLVGNCKVEVEDLKWFKLDLTLVQILVLVAVRFMKFKSMEEGNGWEGMAFVFLLVEPKLSLKR